MPGTPIPATSSTNFGSRTLALLSCVIRGWSALFNTTFDIVEQRQWGRAASDRPHSARLVHAVLLELTSALVCCPLIYATTELTWSQALVADLGLTFSYVTYGYAFHLAYDRVRPAPGAASGSAVAQQVTSQGSPFTSSAPTRSRPRQSEISVRVKST